MTDMRDFVFAAFWLSSPPGNGRHVVQQASGTVPKFTFNSNLVIVDVTVRDQDRQAD